MESLDVSPEAAYLNLPGWRCVPVYALPYASSANECKRPVALRSLIPSNMPSDPKQWSRQQVCFWLEWCIESFSLPPLDVEQFYMNGRGLCLLRKADWRDRAPRSGDVLHNALQLLARQEEQRGDDSFVHQDNVSATLLHHASLYEKGKGLVGAANHVPTQSWPRSISSDFHSMGHVVHESDHHNNGIHSSDAESPLTPNPEDLESSPPNNSNNNPLNGKSNNGPIENGPIAGLNSNFVPASQVLQLKSCGENENGVEKINVRLLWDFLQQLLNDKQQRYNCCIMWKDKAKGVFKITDPHRLAGLWGKQKNHLNMNFDKMSRALRYYYRVRILQKEPGERHCYRFLRHPNELRHCKQRSLLTKGASSIPPVDNSTTSLECGNVEAVLDMSIKEEDEGAGSSPPEDLD